MRGIGPEEAYALAIEMDTLEGYVEFVEAYPGHPLTRRVWAMIRARREALAWFACVLVIPLASLGCDADTRMS